MFLLSTTPILVLTMLLHPVMKGGSYDVTETGGQTQVL